MGFGPGRSVTETAVVVDDGPLVIDTMIASMLMSRKPADAVARYGPMLVGRPLVVSHVTVTELRFGALAAGWGPNRLEALEARLSAMTVVVPDDDLVWVCARLRAAAKNAGLGLWAKDHEADRWIAATAVRYDLPLVSDDSIFVGVPDLDLRQVPI